MADRPGDFDLRWEMLIADAWADPQLKARLLKDPQAVFAERGMSLPAGVTAQVHEDSESSVNLVLPPPPEESELSEEELESVAGGDVDLCFSLCCGNGGGGGGGGGGGRCSNSRCSNSRCSNSRCSNSRCSSRCSNRCSGRCRP